MAKVNLRSRRKGRTVKNFSTSVAAKQGHDHLLKEPFVPTGPEMSENDRAELRQEFLKFFKEHGEKGQDPEKAAEAAVAIFPR